MRKIKKGDDVIVITGKDKGKRGTVLRSGTAIEGNYALQPAAGVSGVKTATASGYPNGGNAHILALRPASGAAGVPIFYIHSDHLNTPRLITNQAQQAVWRSDHAEPFGTYPANENPSGLGVFEFNLRFPGQYADKETNTHQNYFRDYDPAIGRYIQSDPLGILHRIGTTPVPNTEPRLPLSVRDPQDVQQVLRIGLNHSYAYGNLNPLSNTDPKGLQACPEGQQLVTDWTCVTGRALIWSPAYIAFACVALASPALGPVLGPIGFVGSAGLVSALAYYDNYLLCSTCVDCRKPPGR